MADNQQRSSAITAVRCVDYPNKRWHVWVGIPFYIYLFICIVTVSVDILLTDTSNCYGTGGPYHFFPVHNSCTNCMLLSHFSFNDFITLAFLDLAKDLDIQI